MSSGQVTPAGRDRAGGTVWGCRGLSVEKKSLSRPGCPRLRCRGGGAGPCAGGRSLAWAGPHVGGASEPRSPLLMSPVTPHEEGGLQPHTERSRGCLSGGTSTSWFCTGPTPLTVHTHVVRGVSGTPAPQASAGSRAESLQPPAPAGEAPCSPVSTRALGGGPRRPLCMGPGSCGSRAT